MLSLICSPNTCSSSCIRFTVCFLVVGSASANYWNKTGSSSTARSTILCPNTIRTSLLTQPRLLKDWDTVFWPKRISRSPVSSVIQTPQGFFYVMHWSWATFSSKHSTFGFFSYWTHTTAHRTSYWATSKTSVLKITFPMSTFVNSHTPKLSSIFRPIFVSVEIATISFWRFTPSYHSALFHSRWLRVIFIR